MDTKSRIIPIALVLAAVTISVVVQACGGSKTLIAYEGERRPADQVAIIDISNKSLYVMGIDSNVNRYAAFTERFIEVAPGSHTLTVNYKSWKGRSEEPIELPFTAAAGHTYQVKVSAGYNRWTAWIVDVADGSVVAGSPN